jgi:hypothetical protein
MPLTELAESAEPYNVRLGRMAVDAENLMAKGGRFRWTLSETPAGVATPALIVSSRRVSACNCAVLATPA